MLQFQRTREKFSWKQTQRMVTEQTKVLFLTALASRFFLTVNNGKSGNIQEICQLRITLLCLKCI